MVSLGSKVLSHSIPEKSMENKTQPKSRLQTTSLHEGSCAVFSPISLQLRSSEGEGQRKREVQKWPMSVSLLSMVKAQRTRLTLQASVTAFDCGSVTGTKPCSRKQFSSLRSIPAAEGNPSSVALRDSCF